MKTVWEETKRDFVGNTAEATQQGINKAIDAIVENERKMGRLLQGIPEPFRSNINKDLEARENEISKLDGPKSGGDFTANQKRRDTMLEALKTHQKNLETEMLPKVREFKKLYQECRVYHEGLRQEVAEHDQANYAQPMVSPIDKAKLEQSIPEQLEQAASQSDLARVQEKLTKIDNKIDTDLRKSEKYYEGDPHKTTWEQRSDYFAKRITQEQREGHQERMKGSESLTEDFKALADSRRERLESQRVMKQAQALLDKQSEYGQGSRGASADTSAPSSPTHSENLDHLSVDETPRSETYSAESSAHSSPTNSESSLIDHKERLKEMKKEDQENQEDLNESPSLKR